MSLKDDDWLLTLSQGDNTETVQSLTGASVAERLEDHPVDHFRKYWMQLGGNNTPERALFHPAGCARILTWMAVFDLVHLPDGSRTFRYRLIGEGIKQLYAYNPTGRLLEDVVGGNALIERRSKFLAAIDKGCPQYAVGAVPVEGRDFLVVANGVFPFLIGGEPRQVMLVAAPEGVRLRTRTANTSPRTALAPTSA